MRAFPRCKPCARGFGACLTAGRARWAFEAAVARRAHSRTAAVHAQRPARRARIRQRVRASKCTRALGCDRPGGARASVRGGRRRGGHERGGHEPGARSARSAGCSRRGAGPQGWRPIRAKGLSVRIACRRCVHRIAERRANGRETPSARTARPFGCALRAASTRPMPLGTMAARTRAAGLAGRLSARCATRAPARFAELAAGRARRPSCAGTTCCARTPGGASVAGTTGAARAAGAAGRPVLRTR